MVISWPLKESFRPADRALASAFSLPTRKPRLSWRTSEDQAAYELAVDDGDTTWHSGRIDSTDDPVFGVTGWLDLRLPRAQLEATLARLAAIPNVTVTY